MKGTQRLFCFASSLLSSHFHVNPRTSFAMNTVQSASKPLPLQGQPLTMAFHTRTRPSSKTPFPSTSWCKESTRSTPLMLKSSSSVTSPTHTTFQMRSDNCHRMKKKSQANVNLVPRLQGRVGALALSLRPACWKQRSTTSPQPETGETLTWGCQATILPFESPVYV